MNTEPFDVIVSHKYVPDAQYIGRPSPLGNPFVMRSEEERDAVCNQYEAWFKHKVAENDIEIMGALRRLIAVGKRDGVLRLGCYCAPKRCHGDTIARWLEENQ